MDRFITKQRRHAEKTADILGDFKAPYYLDGDGKRMKTARPTPNFEFPANVWGVHKPGDESEAK